MKEKYSEELVFLSVGGGGVYGRYEKEGYSNCRIEYPDKRLSPYLGELKEGGYVIDKRPLLDHPSFVHWVVKCPLLDLKLGLGEIKQFDSKQIKTLKSMLSGLEGSFKALAVKVLNNEECISSLDSISLDLYIEFWESKGARVGQRKGNQIYWNDGEVASIPKFEDRYSDAE